MTSSAFTDHLQQKLDGFLQQVLESPLWASVADPKADPLYVRTVIKYVLLEIFSYGPHVTEATFTAIGRFPKDRPDLMKPMILHDISEVNHCEIALRDFVRLGGDESWARSRRITPASFAMAATVRMLAQSESPFAYLGYMYPFESLTPVLTAHIQPILARQAFPAESQRFIDFHATEDIAHAKALRAFVERVVAEYPSAKDAIEYAFDCFSVVYPIPIWTAAEAHARLELEGRPIL